MFGRPGWGQGVCRIPRATTDSKGNIYTADLAGYSAQKSCSRARSGSREMRLLRYGCPGEQPGILDSDGGIEARRHIPDVAGAARRTAWRIGTLTSVPAPR